jgi:flagella basal body P-ring formation protein FlgA
LKQDMRRGALLAPGDLEWVTTDEPRRRGLGEPLLDPSALEHAELVRDKAAGQVLHEHDIQPALLVRKGQVISVVVETVPGLRISARLEALQDGRHGQTVRLRNVESGRIVSGVVTGPNAARLP